MPDVTRSDSQRSDASLKPRVSFNRDVHVKRIVPREGIRAVGTLSGDIKIPPAASPVRKERLPKSRKALEKEASEVLDRADRVDCVVRNSSSSPEKYYTLPVRKKHRTEYPQASLDRKSRRRNSDDLSVVPPKKPPRTFASSTPASTATRQRPSIFNLFKKSEPAPAPKKSNLRRTASDATNVKSKSHPNDASPLRTRSSENETKDKQASLKKSKKKQLSPIIEAAPKEDYFAKKKDNDVDAETTPDKKKLSITEQLKEYIDEVDTALFNETGVRVSPPGCEDKPPEIVVIDVDKADQISSSKKSKGSGLGKKIKSLTKKPKSEREKETIAKEKRKKIERSVSVHTDKKRRKPEVTRRRSLEDISKRELSPHIKETIKELNSSGEKEETMIHSSQKPVDKLPLTKGRTVDNMVKRLSYGSQSPPPPRTNVMVSPSVTIQHNGNQPFSYTRGLSPEKTEPTKPIIYAQVVCNNGLNPNKQTIHTAYINGKKNMPHSDSDEGLGTEENSGGFTRKYDDKRTMTRFGDERYESPIRKTSDAYNDMEEEYPITPKVKNITYNGFGRYDKYTENYGYKTEENYFIDSSSRGRADGMDAKRRESLTEQDNGLNQSKLDHFHGTNNRNDVSLRRDQLESRITRRFGEKSYRQSPEYIQKPANVYITESTSRYYRSGSNSPVGYKEKYVSETRIGSKGERRTIESKSRKYFGDGDEYNSYENEPKSLDSQISDYRSSPEQNRQFETSHRSSHHADRYVSKTAKQQKMQKNKDYHKSNPEINIKSYDSSYKYHDRLGYQESYHESLKRERHEDRLNSEKYRKDRYFDGTDSERKDRFGDSGIENDFRRDSGDNFKLSRSSGEKQKREPSNESEDEGFASSLLIASERQHTEDNFMRRRREYETKNNGRESKERDEHHHHQYRGHDVVDYQQGYKTKGRYEYVPRERSIDDGSHYDPRIDKDVSKTTLKRLDKKPPKSEKKSGLEKMKQLFTGKKKKEKERIAREENVRSRYNEYRGSREEIEPKSKRVEANELNSAHNYNNRRRLSTPSSSPTREHVRDEKNENTHSSWFKSLDRLSRKKPKKIEKDSNSTEDETPAKSTPTKNLRFFGDTDLESNGSLRKKPSLKTNTRPSFTNSHTSNGNVRDRMKSQSTRDLHNISEEIGTPEMRRVSNHKSMLNISESDRDIKGSRLSLKPPASPSQRQKEALRSKDDRMRRRKNEVSSVESSTEGDSSQQSQRSVVYLHAATVGDIPGPGYLRNGRRAASREELASNSSSRIQPQVKTLSRSFSVLAPWRPKHYKETLDIDYTQYPKPPPARNGKYEQKITKNGTSRKENASTLKKKAQETKRSNQNNASTLNRKTRSKENVSTLKRSKDETPRGSNSTLYKKKERQPKENNRYSNRDEKKMSSKSMSVESLGGRKSREENRDVSRSISIPRDPEKSAGWFKTNKKSKKSVSSQRL